MKLSIRSKILLSVELTILCLLTVSTYMYIADFEQNFFEVIQWRSDALAQTILQEIRRIELSNQFDKDNIRILWENLPTYCEELYTANQDKEVSHIAVLDTDGYIIAHSHRELKGKTLESRPLIEGMGWRKTRTLLDRAIYHTLVPIVSDQDVYLGVIDIGFPKAAFDQKRNQILRKAVMLFLFFVLVSSVMIFILMHFLVIQPVQYLVEIGKRMAQGNLIHTIEMAERGDEIGVLGTAFTQLSDYFRIVADVAEQVSKGRLDLDVHRRSKRDVLGLALEDMLSYLQNVAMISSQIAEGDLTMKIPLRSDIDAFGRSLRAMLAGLESLIQKIRASAHQIASTSTTIESLTEHDLDIVQSVQDSVGNMVSTVKDMGEIVEEVVQNMGTLASSVEETSTSMTEMTSSIGNIADNTSDLAYQTQKTISAVQEAITILEGVTQKTEVSRQLSQETIQDALRGQEAFEQVKTSMDSIHRMNEKTTETMVQFEQRGRDIGTILDVIREVTEQSSLLALNASIIAAQAGVHGRGFAVIADEMRNLATTVGASTQDIVAIVRTIQQDTQTLMKMINEGSEKVNTGVQRTQQAQEMLQKIISSAERSSTMVADIADALQMQRTTNREIMGDMERVNSMTAEITKATNEQKANTIQINRAVELILEMASQTQEAANLQINGVNQVLESANIAKHNNNENLESSKRINQATTELTGEAQGLLTYVDRFKLRAKDELPGS